MIASTGGADRIRVLDVCGEHLYWVDEAGAQDLLKRGQVHLVRRRGRVRMLQARDDIPAPLTLKLEGRGSAFDHTRYSHRRETPDNPPRVWCLLELARIVMEAA